MSNRIIDKMLSIINNYALEGFTKNSFGNYLSIEEWRDSLNQVAEKWIYKMPTVSVTEKYKHPMIAIIFGLNKSSTIQSWQNAALIEGLLSNKSDIDISEISNKWIDNVGEWRSTPTTIDYSLLAYMLMKYEDCEKIKPAMGTMYSIIKQHIGKDGTAVYRSNLWEYRFVDTLGMVCPFLMLYGKLYGDQEAISIAYKQMDEFIKHGCEENSLPFHAYNIENNDHMGVNAWGRGIGWFILGLESFGDTRKYTRIMFVLADKLISYQIGNDGFSWLVNYKGQCETSGTSLIGNLFWDCYQISGDLKYYYAAEGCINALMKCTTKKGVLWYAQGDSKGLGLYSHTFTQMPFAQGYALKLAARFLKGEL